MFQLKKKNKQLELQTRLSLISWFYFKQQIKKSNDSKHIKSKKKSDHDMTTWKKPCKDEIG